MQLHIDLNQQNFFLVLLKGVMINALCGALITLIIQLSPLDKIPSLLFWLLGDFSYINWLNVLFLALAAIFLVFYLIMHKHKLNYIWLDMRKAYSLGINLHALHINILFVVAICIGVVNSNVGSIGFIGLISPYIARYIFKLTHVNMHNASIVQYCIYSGFIGSILLSIAYFLENIT
jgi:iron complex transport system permease protein